MEIVKERLEDVSHLLNGRYKGRPVGPAGAAMLELAPDEAIRFVDHPHKLTPSAKTGSCNFGVGLRALAARHNKVISLIHDGDDMVCVRLADKEPAQ